MSPQALALKGKERSHPRRGIFGQMCTSILCPFVLVCPRPSCTPIPYSLGTHAQPSTSANCLSYLDAWPIGSFVQPQRTWPTPWFGSWEQWQALHAAIFLWFQQNTMGGIFYFLFCEALSNQLVNRTLWRVCVCWGWGGNKMHAQVTMGTDKLW